MSLETEALFRGRVYRVTTEAVVANTESTTTGAERDLHLVTCRTLKKYGADNPALVPLSIEEADAAWVKAVEDDTTTEMLNKEWPWSPQTGWCPHCVVKELKIAADGSYRHPEARSPKWRPGVPLACRFPTAHGQHCGCPQ